MSYAEGPGPKQVYWPQLCAGCGTTSTLRPFSDVWKSAIRSTYAGTTRLHTIELRVSTYLCLTCLDKSKRWAQNEKAYYAKLRLFSLLIIIVPIFPLSFFGSSASYDAMGTIVSLLSLGWVILGAIVGPVYFNRGMQVYDRFLKEPRHAYVSLTQAGVSEVSFNLTNASYYDAFSKANPGLNVKKSERIPWAVKFPSSLIYIALGFLVVVFLGLGIEFTISIAIRWIIAVVISLLPSFIFAKPDEFSPGGSDEEAPATDVENTADTYETEAETITERIEESEEPDEEEGLDWL